MIPEGERPWKRSKPKPTGSLEREKGRTQDNVSAHYSEHYQMMWLIQAARAYRQ